MSENLQRIFLRALWISTIAILVVLSVQAWSGNWITFLPGAPAQLSSGFLYAIAKLRVYHKMAGFATGGISILTLIFAFVHRSSIYVRIFAVLGFLMTVSAIIGGFLFFTSGFHDRLSLGQMADSFVGAYAAYFLQLFFMGKTSGFWLRTKTKTAGNP